LNEQRPEPSACPSCAGRPNWESITDTMGERWLSVCRCGRIDAFFADQPEARPDDPLAAFLLGSMPRAQAPTPVWVRCFLRSVEEPWNIRWRYRHEPCDRCATRVVFEFLACPREYVLATCRLCLACGHATAEYAKPWHGLAETSVGGSVWTPPCPAVQRLRDSPGRPTEHPLPLRTGSTGRPTLCRGPTT